MKIRFTFLMAFCLMAFFASAQVVDVLTGLNRPWSLALRNNELFIAEDGTGKIIKADISQPNPTAVDVLTGLGNTPFGGMRMKGDEIFFAIYNQGVIRKFDVTQPIPTVVDVATGIPTTYIADILIDGDILYAANARTTGTAGNSFFRIDLSQTPVTIETIFIGHPQLGLAKSGNILYFSEGTQNSPTGDIYKLDLSQPTPTPELVVNVPTAYGLTINGGFLYVSRSGAVSRVDLSQPNPTYEDIATGIGNTRLCTFDGLDLYISIFATQGKVVKLGISQPVFPTLPTVCGNTVPTGLGGASPTGGIYSGPGVTNNGDGSTFSFNPTAAGGPGIYTVTYTAVNGTQVTSGITVAAPPVIGVFGFNTDVAFPPSPLPDPAVGPSGGVYSGPGMLAGNIFDAGLAGVGVHVLTYTFTDANGCTGTGTGNINVNPALNDGCSGASNIDNLFGGAYNVPLTSSLQDNTGYTSNGDPAVSTGCFYQDDAVQRSVWYSFTGDGNTYRIRSVQCNATNYIPDGDTQVAIFTGDCNNQTQVACNDDENGNAGILNFSLDLATVPGENYRVLVDGYGGHQGEFCLEVTNLSQTTITFALGGSVCNSSTGGYLMTGAASPAGGVYSGPGVTDSGDGIVFFFSPAAAGGPGTYTITYTLPNGLSATTPLTVTATPVIGAFGFITDVITPPSPLPDPSAGPAGGVYSGVGVLPGNIFDAGLAGVGVHVLTYTFTDANGCTGTGTGNILVNPAPHDGCADAKDINNLFSGAFNVPMTSALQNNTGYNSNGDPAVSSGCFFNNDPLQHTVWYTFTGDGNTYRIRSVQCNATNYISNGDTQVAIFTGDCNNPTQVACNDDENGNAGILNFNVDITTQSGQTYWVLVDGYNGAQGEFCLEVTNLSQTAISIPSLLATVCSNEGGLIGGATPTGGVYSGPGVTDSGDGSSFIFNPFAAGGPGNYTVTYTLPNGSSATATVTVIAAPVIGGFGFITDVITPPSPLPDPSAGPAGGVYSGVGVLPGNIFDAGLAGVGVHVLTYTFTDANGCTGTGTGNITVKPAPHDDCADAKNINNLFGGAYNVPQTSSLQNNAGYTSNGDPAVSSGCFFQDDAVQHSVWYSFTGDGNTYRLRSVQCSATNYIPDGDTQVAIFTGSCASPTQVACNDDENGNAGILNFSLDLVTLPGENYRVLVDGYNGAQGQFCLEVTNLNLSTVTEISRTNIRLFPNPTTGLVQLTNVIADHVQVFDNQGRLVMQVDQPGSRLDISTVPAGMYFLKIAEGEQVYTARVVKE